VTPLLKSAIDKTEKSFCRLYNGELTPKMAVKGEIEESDAAIHIGPLPSDSNTGGWTQNLPILHLIYLGHDRISVKDRTWTGVHLSLC
jgi:pyruvate decarboxylase